MKMDLKRLERLTYAYDIIKIEHWSRPRAVTTSTTIAKKINSRESNLFW